MKQVLLVDFNNDAGKARLWGVLRKLEGDYRIELTKYVPRRSDRQNSWYWGIVMPLAAIALEDTQGGTWDSEDAHEFFKGRYLATPIIDRQTGELLSTRVRSSAVLTVKEFTHYVEQIRQWLAEYCGIQVPDPDSLGVRMTAPKRKARAAR
jgi:hypothetical protein